MEFGDLVRDKITGFTGIVVAIYSYQTGCTRIEVQPRIGEDGKWIASHAFDEPVLEIVEKGHSVIEESKPEEETGGPALWEDGGK